MGKALFSDFFFFYTKCFASIRFFFVNKVNLVF